MHAQVRVGDVGTGRYIVIPQVHVKLIYGIFHVYSYTACSVYKRLWLSGIWESRW